MGGGSGDPDLPVGKEWASGGTSAAARETGSVCQQSDRGLGESVAVRWRA
jgi:hypothetical protein